MDVVGGIGFGLITFLMIALYIVVIVYALTMLTRIAKGVDRIADELQRRRVE
jgi:hypothetical protein